MKIADPGSETTGASLKFKPDFIDHLINDHNNYIHDRKMVNDKVTAVLIWNTKEEYIFTQ